MDKQTFKASVGASIVAAILVIIFVQPVLTWLWEVFVSGSTVTIAYLTDSIYRSAALGQRDWVVVGMSLIFLGSFGVLAGSRIVRKCLPSWVFSSVKNKLKEDSLSKSIGIVLFDLVGLFSLLYLLTGIYADLQLNTSFQQRLTVLAPHLSEQAEEQLKAQWAMMRNRDDYEQIVAVMEELANTNSVQLPELLLK